MSSCLLSYWQHTRAPEPISRFLLYKQPPPRHCDMHCEQALCGWRALRKRGISPILLYKQPLPRHDDSASVTRQCCSGSQLAASFGAGKACLLCALAGPVSRSRKRLEVCARHRCLEQPVLLQLCVLVRLLRPDAAPRVELVPSLDEGAAEPWLQGVGGRRPQAPRGPRRLSQRSARGRPLAVRRGARARQSSTIRVEVRGAQAVLAAVVLGHAAGRRGGRLRGPLAVRRRACAEQSVAIRNPVHRTQGVLATIVLRHASPTGRRRRWSRRRCWPGQRCRSGSRTLRRCRCRCGCGRWCGRRCGCGPRGWRRGRRSG
mmetsp:Transcript_50939/g.162984  ORF Transcript_50939/g.162984 Transcript_50939/m.162984 type:complete len:317 (-) Transcript_50939:714-1664(-)